MPTPITPNPGGTLSPEQIVGRNALIRSYWEVLENRSMVLLAPRRLGKTSVCRLMVNDAPTRFVARYRDLEGRAASAMEVVKTLLDDLKEFIPASKRAALKTHALFQAIGGTIETPWLTLQAQKQDWRALLDALFADMERWAIQEDKIIVLFWDEFTLFLNDLANSGDDGAQDAMTLLDRLRAARQTHTRVRLVYTGSIGLEEVLRDLRRRGYANDPTNDMATRILPRLDPPAATSLATRLLASFNEPGAFPPGLAEHIADICEGHPFLIQHVTDRMRLMQALLTRAAAERALESLLDDASDPLELSHYIERLQKYFGEDDHALALDVLDALAAAERPLSFAEVSAVAVAKNRNQLIDVLKVLRQDLYVVREGGRWAFSLTFLKRYWALERPL